MEENMKTLIRNEVKKQLSAVDGSKETKENIVKDLTIIVSDMEKNLTVLKEFCASLVEEEPVAEQQPVLVPVLHPRKRTKEEAEPEPEEEEEDLGADIDEGWVKTQDGNLEKGEKQIWKYGNHELVVWNDGKKFYASVDGEEDEELWRQKDLEKIQRRVEKLP